MNTTSEKNMMNKAPILIPEMYEPFVEYSMMHTTEWSIKFLFQENISEKFFHSA